MESVELPVTEEPVELAPIPVNFAEQPMDIAAFELWRDASRISPVVEEETAK